MFILMTLFKSEIMFSSFFENTGKCPITFRKISIKILRIVTFEVIINPKIIFESSSFYIHIVKSFFQTYIFKSIFSSPQTYFRFSLVGTVTSFP